MALFIAFFALVNVCQIFGTPKTQQNESLAEQIQKWEPMRPKELVMNVREMVHFLLGTHMMSTMRSYNTTPAGATLSHFLQIDNSAELYSCATTIRNASNLCRMRAFVGAVLSRLGADFAQIGHSKKWRSDVAQGLTHLDTEFADVALKKREISESRCAELIGDDEELRQLANLIRVKWVDNEETVPEFVLDCIKRGLTHFLHEHSFSVGERIALVEHIANWRIFMGEMQKRKMPIECDQFIGIIKAKKLNQLVKLFGEKTMEHFGSAGHFLTRDGFFKTLIEFFAKMTEIKVLLKKGAWKKIHWHFSGKKLCEMESLHFFSELFSFGLEVANLLGGSKPRKFKQQINAIADQKWPLWMDFHQSFSQFVSCFRQRLRSEMPEIAPVDGLLSHKDICMAWLFLYYQLQHGADQQPFAELDEADVEMNCEGRADQF